MKKKILAAMLATSMVMSMTGVPEQQKAKKRVKELPLFMELPDIVKKWEMQD